MCLENLALVNFDHNDEAKFLEQIKLEIMAGWQPLSGISTAIGINKETDEEYYMFSQAMVIYHQ
jgi:hypothetical protein